MLPSRRRAVDEATIETNEPYTNAFEELVFRLGSWMQTLLNQSMHDSTFGMRMICKINVALLKFPVYNVEELVGIAAFEALGYHSKTCSASKSHMLKERKGEDMDDSARILVQILVMRMRMIGVKAIAS
jgi:hypothetical protein